MCLPWERLSKSAEQIFFVSSSNDREKVVTHFAHLLARKMDPLASGASLPIFDNFAKQRYHVVSRWHYDVLGDLSWKRAVDILLSVVALILVSPILLTAAVLVKITSPGPVIFKQERVGLDRRRRDRRDGTRDYVLNRRSRERRVLINFGRPFTIYKFRTMVAEAEQGKPMWAQKKDPRITPIGMFFRKTRIDELPQFLNVLKGDMSIVGPRPERAYFIGKIEKDIPEFQLRLRTKPGITGLAQVELGYTNTNEGLREKLRFDLEYIKKLSLRTDFKILFKTVFVVLTGKGAC